MNPETARFLLKLVLRVGGCICLLAFLAVVMPTSWMETTHRWLGLGDFPDSALTQYLTRSIAALYGFHGVFMLILSTDTVRFRPLVRFLGWMEILFGLAVLMIDLHAGLPWWWVALEGPPVTALGVVVLWLANATRSAEEGP